MSDHSDNITGESLVNQSANESRAQEARMLPSTGELTQDQITYVRKMINRACDEQSVTLDQIEKKIGCSRKAVHRFMDGTYAHSDSNFARRLDRWLKSTQQSGGDMPSCYVPNNIAQKMIGVINQVFRRKSMGAVVGPSGVSKSTVLKAIQSGLIPNSLHIELNCTDGTVSHILRRISHELGLCDQYASQRLMQRLTEHLRGTDRLLMLDEAHYLNKKAMNAVRDLHKATGCPIVLVGTQDLLETIDDFNEFHGQMKSLVSMTYNITREATQTGTPLYSVDEIISYAKSMNLRLDISGADFVAHKANILGWGGLRSAAYLMLNAALLAKGRVITAKMLNTALREMEGYDGFQKTKFKGKSAQNVKVA